MNTSIEARRRPAKRLGIFALGIAVACAGMFGLGASKADAAATNQPFTMQLNDALMNLGFAFTDQEILPAPTNLKQAPTTPLPNWWDIVESTLGSGGTAPCTLNTSPFFPCGSNPANAEVSAVGGAGNLAPGVAWPFGTQSTWNPQTGAIALNRVVGAGQSPSGTPFNYDVRFPIMSVVSPTTGDDVPLTLVATGPLTGTLSNGELTLTPGAGTTLEARVLVGLGIPASAGGAQPFTFCKVDLPSATLSTGAGTGTASYNGTPFNFGIEGSGAFQASWTITNNAVPVVQGRGVVNTATDTPANASQTAAFAALASCASGNDGAAVNAAIKGAGGTWMGNRVEVPKCAEDQIGTYPDCVDPKANISKIQVTGGSKVKAKKKLKLTVKVTNNGTADESVKLRLWSSAGGVASVTGSVTINATAGGTSSKKVTVSAKKKGKTTIHATNGAKTGKRNITVR